MLRCTTKRSHARPCHHRSMQEELPLAGAHFELAGFGELISEPSRVAMLLALMDGSARPATELANIAGISRSTASAHLQRLLVGGLVRVSTSGRHRYYALASERVADAVEALTLLRPAPAPRSPSATPERRRLAAARTCYRHLAGKLGVAWLGALQRARFVTLREPGVVITKRGARAFLELGLATDDDTPWPSGKLCLDWTERRYHLGGSLGTRLTTQLFRVKWIARRGDGRALRVTTRGEQALADAFALTLPP